MYGRVRLVQVVRKLVSSPLVSALALGLITASLVGVSSSSQGSPQGFSQGIPPAPQALLQPNALPFSAPEQPDAPPPPASVPFLGMDEELLLERLRSAEISSIHFSRGGSSLVLRVEFADGSRAAFKPQQIHPQSVPRKEAAAYTLSRKLGISAVPPTVMRAISRDELLRKLDPESQFLRPRLLREAIFDASGVTMGSMMYWVPGLADLGLDTDRAILNWQSELSQKGELSPDRSELLGQLSTLLAFDVIQNNSDRFSGGNILGLRSDRRMFYIDNAFGFQPDPHGHLRALGYLSRCQKFSQRLWVKLQLLRDEDLVFDDPIYGPLLTKPEVQALRSRRDRVVHYLGQLIQSYGSKSVLAFR